MKGILDAGTLPQQVRDGLVCLCTWLSIGHAGTIALCATKRIGSGA